MARHTRLALALASFASLAALAPLAHADFSQFFVFGEAPQISRTGSAVHENYVERLTTAGGQGGAMWWNVKQQMNRGFTNTFRFRRELGPQVIDGDGFAVVIQNQSATALGPGGSDMGYAGITQGLAVEFDTFVFGGDFPAVHVSIQRMVGGALSSADSASLAHVVLSDINVPFDPYTSYEGTVQYLPPVAPATLGTLQVYLGTTLVLTHNINLATQGVLDAQGKAFVGFTAGTGLADTTHIIETWAFSENVGDTCPFTYWHAAWTGSFTPPFGIFGGVHVIGKRPITYHLYKNGVEITDDLGGRLTGLGTQEFRLSNYTPEDPGYYKITFQNECGSGDFGAFFVPEPGTCFDIDFNNDGVAPDSQDITDMLSVFGGGPCTNDPYCDPIDFNNDGVSPDSADIEAMLRVFGGGACEG